MPIPKFKFNDLTRTDVLQFDGVNFVNVPVYAVGKNVMWGPEGVGYNSLIVGDVTKNIPLVNHKHTTDDILGLQELINDLGVNSNSGTNIDLSNYLLTSTFTDHLNNVGSAKHVTQAHLDKLNNYWQLDEQGNLYTTYNTYSTQGLSAYGFGDEGSGGGGIIETVYGYNNLGQTFNNANLTDTFNAYTINRLHDRVTTLEAGGVGGSVAWADITGKPSTFTPSSHGHGWSEITGKPSTFTPSSHSHWWSDITGKPSTFTPSAHSHGVADISGLSATLGSYVTVGTTQTISGAKTFSANLTASVSVTTPKVIFAAAGWSLEQTGTELQMKYNGTAKLRFLSGGSIVAAQEITAYS